MNHTPDPAFAESSGSFDPKQAAALLDQTTLQARRSFTSGPPLLWVYRAAFVLVAFGGYWLDVRHRNPYSAPSGGLLAVIFTLVAINIGVSFWLLKRASTGVSGPAQSKKRTWIALMLPVWVIAFAVTAPLYHASASHPTWGLYPANAPLMIVGLVAAGTAALIKDWQIVCTMLAIAIAATVAGFGGPAGAWLILGIEMCAVCLGTAAFKFSQRHRSAVRP
ncbi:MAG TPA: hypothetical protein VMR14_12115 [Streptosporangiaceae bacterium]|jgi:hypothetical protein|nr:hypothetical protein [Streptosporangiaceae bacterium]